MNVHEILKHANLDANEKKVIDVLYDSLQKNNNITIRELSKKTYMSTGSIVRLAKKLGFYGYSDMLYSFKKQQQELVEFTTKESLSNVALSKESLAITDDLIQTIVDNDKMRIHLFGVGYSDIVATYMRDKLIEINYFATNINPLDSVSNDEYVLILISNSGETVDLIDIAKKCKRNGNCKIYLITSQENSTLSKLINNHIVIYQADKVKNRYGSYFTGNAIILMEKIITAIYNLKF